MNITSTATKELYYTKDHEWINFQDAIAFTGVCSFKLIGFKAIQQVVYSEPSAPKKRGDIIATIKYNDYVIEAHMPVDGLVLQLNTNLIYGEDDLLVTNAATTWVAKIAPFMPLERTGLLLPMQYMMKSNSTLY